MEILLSLKKIPQIMESLVLNHVAFMKRERSVVIPLVKENSVFHVHEIIKPFIMPDNDPIFLIKAYEEGGRFNGLPVGDAIVVGGVSGKRLRFFERERCVAKRQATFKIPWGVVLGKLNANLCGTRHEIILTLCQVRVASDKSFAWFNEKEIWRGGEKDPIPPRIESYTDMIQTLKEKAHCYQCQCVHFSAK